MDLSFAALGERDVVRLLFSEKPALVLQVEDGVRICEELKFAGVDAYVIGDVNFERRFRFVHDGLEMDLLIDELRDTWFKTSYLLDRRQSGAQKASERFANYKNQELRFRFPETFTGKLSQWGLETSRRCPTGVRAAIIREKGINGDREMAWFMYLAGMDVKDVHMTDLIEGRETLEDVNMIVFPGGFSNSDVLGSAKGWAGAFLYNEKAKQALDRFYARPDTLSLGVCNGCQLMIELGLVTPDHERKPRMLHNESHKFESAFVGVRIEPNESVMLRSLAGSELGIWVGSRRGPLQSAVRRESLPHSGPLLLRPVSGQSERERLQRSGPLFGRRSPSGHHASLGARDPAVELGLLSRGSGRGRGDPVDRGFRQRPPLDRG